MPKLSSDLIKPIRPDDWPEPYRQKFDSTYSGRSKQVIFRAGMAFGRWLAFAASCGNPPELVTPELVSACLAGWPVTQTQILRQTLSLMFPNAKVYEGKRPKGQNDRAERERYISKTVSRLPEKWQAALASGLFMDPEQIEDGLLIALWSRQTMMGIFSRALTFFKYCRDNGLPEDICRISVCARLQQRQKQVAAGEITIATVASDFRQLHQLAVAAFPSEDWTWLDPAISYLRKLAKKQPTRNNSRIVNLAELKIAAIDAAQVAAEKRVVAITRQEQSAAFRLARTALALNLLIHSPIRLESLGNLDLKQHFTADLHQIELGSGETKERKRDIRIIPAELREQILQYLDMHRCSFAHPDQTRLFLGSNGATMLSRKLSLDIGNLTEKLFARRITAHAIRNNVAAFIVSEAPERAGLASIILNHSSARTTETYKADANQIVASWQLSAATGSKARSVAAKTVMQPSQRTPAGK